MEEFSFLTVKLEPMTAFDHMTLFITAESELYILVYS